MSMLGGIPNPISLASDVDAVLLFGYVSFQGIVILIMLFAPFP